MANFSWHDSISFLKSFLRILGCCILLLPGNIISSIFWFGVLFLAAEILGIAEELEN